MAVFNRPYKQNVCEAVGCKFLAVLLDQTVAVRELRSRPFYASVSIWRVRCHLAKQIVTVNLVSHLGALPWLTVPGLSALQRRWAFPIVSQGGFL
jgi:hypothetical protein